MRNRFGLLLLCFALTASAKTALLTNVPLVWKPTSQLQLGSMAAIDSTVRFEPFQDVRGNKEKIGENLEDKVSKPVTTSGDVGAFVSAHMRELFDKAGIKTTDGADAAVTVKGEVRQFFVTETNTYEAQVEVEIMIVGRDGSTLFKGIASGDANRFGRSYKLENYYETLSDSVVNTVSSMLRSPEIQKALAGK
jgi:hypothetical protein